MRITTTVIFLTFASVASAQAPPRWDWDAPGDALGWGREHNLAPLEVADGILRTHLTGADPWIIGPPIEVDAAAYPFIQLRLRANHFAAGSIYFTRADDPDFSQDKLLSFRLTSDTQFTETLLDLREHREWTGTITQLRLDPLDVYPTAVAAQEVEVDFVHFVADAERPAEIVASRLTGPRTAIVPEDKPFAVSMTLTNTGGQRAEGLEPILKLRRDSGAARLLAEAPASLGPGESTELAWEIAPQSVGPHPAAATVLFGNHPPVYGILRTFIEPSGPPDEVATVQGSHCRFVIERHGDSWGLIKTVGLGRDGFFMPSSCALFAAYEDVLHPWEAAPRQVTKSTGQLRIFASAPGPRLHAYSSNVTLQATRQQGVMKLVHRADAPGSGVLRGCIGPTIYLGEPRGGRREAGRHFPRPRMARRGREVLK